MTKNIFAEAVNPIRDWRKTWDSGGLGWGTSWRGKCQWKQPI